MKAAIIFSALSAAISGFSDHNNLIVAYHRAKSLSFATVFSCQGRKNDLQTAKQLAKNQIRFLIAPRLQTEALYRKYNNLGVVLDGSCNTSALASLNKKYFYETYHWLILATESQAPIIEKTLQKTALNINSDLNLAISGRKTAIVDVYNPASGHGGALLAAEIGAYSGGAYPKTPASNKYWRRKNMTGVAFASAIVIPGMQMPLEEYVTSEAQREYASMHRFQHATVAYAAEFYNFSLRLEATGSWGYMGADGHFDGLVGLLERRQVDFGSSPLIYKLDRMPVVDYSYGNWILKSTFIYRKPKIIEASHRIFLRPLSGTVWCLIGAMMAVVLALLKVVFSRERRLLPEAPEGVDSGWSFLVLFALGAFCQQGATCYPQLMSSRTLSVFVFLFCILIYQFYSASIVSYLLIDPPRRINNLRDLSDSDLRAGIEDILIDRNYFVQTTDPAAIDLYAKKIKGASNESGFFEPAVGVELVRRGGFAFHVETSSAYPIIEATFSNQEICDLEEVQMYRTQPMHTNLQKDSPFREMMNYFMLRMVEDGNMYRLRKFWDARKPACMESAKKVEIHVSLKEFLAGPIVLVQGILLALMFLIGEFFVFYRRRIFNRWLMVHKNTLKHKCKKGLKNVLNAANNS